MNSPVQNVIDNFTPISLFEMDIVALLKRVDTKFLMRADLLPSLLEELNGKYKVLEIKGKRILSYKSLYFDTSRRKFYYDHHNGKIKRTKIRIRKYIESDIYFLEVKQKDGKGNTDKSRVKIDFFEKELSEGSARFISQVTGKNYDLEPSLWNQFRRITLVSTEEKERVTIDMNLSFEDMSDKTASVDNMVIVELKQERFNPQSTIVRALRKRSVYKYGFSKYCIGMIKLYATLKYNRFKPKLLRIKKLTA